MPALSQSSSLSTRQCGAIIRTVKVKTGETIPQSNLLAKSLASTKRVASRRRAVNVLVSLVFVIAFCASAQARCRKNGPYDPSEIAGSTFFTTREQSKFATSERSYPLASGGSARYCFSRGCSGQLTVNWTDQEQAQLRELRAMSVKIEDPSSELRFIKIATLQLESWLYKRLLGLNSATVSQIMKRVAGNYGHSQSEHMTWLAGSISSYGRFDKECATYAMEATQHLLVLANLGLIQHWNVKAPVYRYGIPGHWTAALENRDTCENYRFDLNSRASARFDLHVRGQNPAALMLQNPQGYGHLLPGMDGNGIGRPSEHSPFPRPLK